nr:NAD(P)-dependent oxidoreductase [Marinicella sp. W31]MDC2878996.1 NAD(P)-dependent oxidoreductase [Marinicella sp. W31]
MLHDPILLVGGAGFVGRQTAQHLRKHFPDVPLLIGGRNLARAEEAAAEIGNARGVAVDLAKPDLGLGDQPVSALALFFKEDSLGSLRFAQSRGSPISAFLSGIHELAPEVAAHMLSASSTPVVLGAEWLVGATTIPALEAAKAFGTIDDVRVSAIIDENDIGGPATYADMERLTKMMPAALSIENGAYVWRTGEEVQTEVTAVDGTTMPGELLSPNDVLILAEATKAPNVAFRLAIGESSSRRSGEPLSTEIIVELSGKSHDGAALKSAQAVVHSGGQMPLTGMGVAMLLERLAGLSGEPVAAGLYFPPSCCRQKII